MPNNGVRITDRGIVYGSYEMDANKAAEFMKWAAEKRFPAAAPILLKYTPGTCEFNAVWETIARTRDDWKRIQLEFLMEE